MNLDRQSLGILISRIIGIYILLQAISYLAFVSNYFQYADGTWRGLLSAIVAFLLTLGLSYFFLAHAPKASRFLMSDTQEAANSDSIDQASIVRVAFLIIGGFLVVQALPGLTSNLCLYSEGLLVGPRAIAYLGEGAVRLAIGLFLIIGGGSWQRFLLKMRS